MDTTGEQVVILPKFGFLDPGPRSKLSALGTQWWFP